MSIDGFKSSSFDGYLEAIHLTWRLNPASGLHWRCWDNEWVLFDQGSGQTHLINPISAAALMQFEGQFLSIEQLLGKVASDMSLSISSELASAVSLAVEQLIGLGLLESASA